MKISARNVLKGKVVKVTPGAVNSEVILELPGGTRITSIITKESVESLGLEGRQRSLRGDQSLERDDRH